jgi:hypothetical protein
MSKFKYKNEFTEKNFKSEFIISCFQLPKSRHKEIAWAKEMKIMNSLVQKCPEIDFWFHARPDFSIPSLAWFLTQNGRRYLNEKYKTFKLELNCNSAEHVELGHEKHGEDQLLKPKKPKTIMDFIKKN